MRTTCSLSVHALNTTSGRGCEGLRVTLEEAAGEGAWRPLHSATTDANGRIAKDALPAVPAGGVYRMSFDTGAYFTAQNVKEYFFPAVRIEFITSASGSPHYHVPLLLSPFGYSTYRGN